MNRSAKIQNWQQRLVQVDLETARKSLPEIGQSLDAGFCELQRDLAVDRVDCLLAKLTTAQNGLKHVRRALMSESGIHRHGTG